MRVYGWDMTTSITRGILWDMNTTEQKHHWEGNMEDLLLRYFLYQEFKLSDYILSEDQLRAFDNLLWESNHRNYPGGI